MSLMSQKLLSKTKCLLFAVCLSFWLQKGVTGYPACLRDEDMDEDEGWDIFQEYQCFNSTLDIFSDVREETVECTGFGSCSDSIWSNPNPNTSTVHVDCLGAASCVNINMSGSVLDRPARDVVTCAGYFSCANNKLTVGPTFRVVATGSLALANNVVHAKQLDTEEVTSVTLNGFAFGALANLYAMDAEISYITGHAYYALYNATVRLSKNSLVRVSARLAAYKSTFYCAEGYNCTIECETATACYGITFDCDTPQTCEVTGCNETVGWFCPRGSWTQNADALAQLNSSLNWQPLDIDAFLESELTYDYISSQLDSYLYGSACVNSMKSFLSVYLSLGLNNKQNSSITSCQDSQGCHDVGYSLYDDYNASMLANIDGVLELLESSDFNSETSFFCVGGKDAAGGLWYEEPYFPSTFNFAPYLDVGCDGEFSCYANSFYSVNLFGRGSKSLTTLHDFGGLFGFQSHKFDTSLRCDGREACTDNKMIEGFDTIFCLGDDSCENFLQVKGVTTVYAFGDNSFLQELPGSYEESSYGVFSPGNESFNSTVNIYADQYVSYTITDHLGNVREYGNELNIIVQGYDTVNVYCFEPEFICANNIKWFNCNSNRSNIEDVMEYDEDQADLTEENTGACNVWLYRNDIVENDIFSTTETPTASGEPHGTQSGEEKDAGMSVKRLFCSGMKSTILFFIEIVMVVLIVMLL